MATGLAISTVGALLQAASQTKPMVMSVNPTSVGNLFYLAIMMETSTAGTDATAVTGGNCVGLPGSGGWTKLSNSTMTTSTSVVQFISQWVGVSTATGATNLTITTTASSSIWVDLTGQQFTCASVGPNTVWAIDGAAANKTNTASTTSTFPTLTPANTNSAYLGSSYPAGAISTTGQTAGYTVEVDANSNALLFKTSVSGAQTPTAVITASRVSTTMAALLTATNKVSTTGFMPFFGMGHHEDELEQRSSGLYVQRRKLAGIRPNGGKDRVLARV